MEAIMNKPTPSVNMTKTIALLQKQRQNGALSESSPPPFIRVACSNDNDDYDDPGTPFFWQTPLLS
jgi:hypothetical protein